MAVNPRIIGTDGDDEEIDRAAGGEGRGIDMRGITGKTEAVSVSFNEISIVTAMIVAAHPGSPVPELESGQGDFPAGSWCGKDMRLIPVQLVDMIKSQARDNIGGVACGHHQR